MSDRPRPAGCLGVLLSWLASAFALFVAAELVPGITLENFFPDALIAVAVLGLLNGMVRPILVLLTLPVTFLTLGIFLLVINGALFGLAAWFLDGLAVSGLMSAMGGAIVMSVVNGLLSRLIGARDHDDD